MEPTWKRVREIVEAALGIESSKRDEFVARECGTDLVLLEEVRALLRAEADSSTLSGLTPAASAWIDDFANEPLRELRPGAMLGRYRIVREIASGGMGTVYEAEQSNPARRVALKTLRVGHFDAEARRRFDYEAEALARLQHPNIALIFEAGIDDRPYFAMERIDGARSITAFAAEKKLTLLERLRLFAPVCDAIHHGHQRGVLHRDLKPSNILVDKEGTPKVIDYGVARVSTEDRERTLRTTPGEILGTLQYMSPEQLEGNSASVDVRADVFALGAVLHELICGRPLFDIRGLSPVEAVSRLSTVEPKPPSAFDPSIPREIDWIIGRATERDPERRYRSVDVLGTDIARYLVHEPLEAGPPSGFYRAQKFVRRHRVLFAATASIVISLAIGLAVALSQKRAALRAAHAAEESAAQANETLRFVRNIFATVRVEPGSRDVSVKNVLDNTAQRLETELKDQPAIEATIRSILADCYICLDEVPRAQSQIEKAIELRRVALGENHVDTLRSRASLGNVLVRQLRFDEGERELRASSEGLIQAVGESDRDVAVVLTGLAVALRELGRMDDAVATMRRAEQIAAKFSPGSEELAVTRFQLAMMLLAVGKQEEALQLISIAEEAAAGQTIIHHDYRIQVKLVAAQQRMATDPKQSVVELESTYQDAKEHLGPQHAMTISALAVLARACVAADDLDRAVRYFEEAEQLAIATHGEDDYLTYATRRELAKALAAQGRNAEAETRFRQSIDSATRSLGATQRDTLESRVAFAIFLSNTKRFAEAEQEFQELARIAPEVTGATSPLTASAIRGLARAQEARGRSEDAIATLTPFVELARRELGKDHAETGRAEGDLAHSLVSARRFADAVPVLERLFAAFEKTGQSNAPGVAAVAIDLGIARRECGDFAGSERALQRALEVQRAQTIQDPDATARIERELAATRTAREKK